MDTLVALAIPAQEIFSKISRSSIKALVATVSDEEIRDIYRLRWGVELL
jgi:IS4 transposase